MRRYVHNANRVVLNDNQNGKKFGTSCIMCAHALGDTPIPSRGYGRVHPMARQRSLCLA